MSSSSAVRPSSSVIRRRLPGTVAVLGLVLLGSPVLAPAAQAAAPAPDDESSLRIGVLALAGAVSAVGQTPELATPLPFTSTSIADVLQLDERLTADLTDALAGADLEEALAELDGVTLVETEDDDQIAFTYTRVVDDHPLALVHDDGDLRFGASDGAGSLDVSLTTDPDHPFVVAVDETQPDPLLRVALVSQPTMALSVDIDTDDLDPFDARQGFTEVEMTGGHYRIHRDQTITMRDPDGRSALTLEDLRYSTLPDLFRVATGDDSIDVELGVELPASLGGGTAAERQGSLSVDAESGDEPVWPTAADADRGYGAALSEATGLSMVDGLSSLAQYTGTVLALQDAADVPFPNLAGGTTDLFAPGDRLLDLLSTAASAQVRCGAAPQTPPVGVAAPGDSVYCTATTAEGLGEVTDVAWSTNDGDGTVASGTDAQAAAVGTAPADVVRIDGSDGEPDVTVSFTAGGQELTARSMPMTVQDVVRRIEELGESEAEAALNGGRLDVSVELVEGTASKKLPVGSSDTLGALVGLTGLGDGGGDDARATAIASDASFDVGFGIETGDVADGTERETFLLPRDTSLLRVGGLSATAPTNVVDLPARIGFLGVTADLTSLSLGTTSGDPAVELARTDGESGALRISEVLNGDGALRPGLLELDSHVTAGIAFTATEKPLTPGGSTYVSGADGPASGAASVSWNPGGLPQVSFGDGYQDLRAFDPVPAAFLSGTAHVTPGSETTGDTVTVDLSLPDGSTAYDLLGVAAPADGGPDVEVARRLVAAGLACQNVLLVDEDTLTCEGLAPNGEAGAEDGATLDLIVLGDPFALRDSVLEGLSTTLSSFDRLDGDNLASPLAVDQYTSTLPLVDLKPEQLAVEREALAQGLAAMVKQAAVDEAGGSSGASVSSAQELTAAAPGFVKVPGQAASYAPQVAFTLGDQLGVRLSASAPSSTTLEAPLRFSVDGPGQVTSDATFDVPVTSETILAIDVDPATARPSIADATGTTSDVSLGLGSAALDEKLLRAGVGDLEVTGTGSAADLGVRVVTDYVATGDGGVLRTTRASTRSGKAAVADLVVGADTLHVEFDATDSSGGEGTAQPAPEAMEVKYVAEGLDGLAAALASAMDGAAPRNLGDSGAPISAPLIGTDLDAGAGVADILTGLTSDLRDELEDVNAETAGDLEDQLEAAVEAAVDGATGLEDVAPTDVSATVTCGGTDGGCEPCVVDPEVEDPPVCTTDGPTGWETVSITTTLTGSEKEGETTFDTGLAGLEVRSDLPVDTATSWTLPITLELARGVGPRVRIEEGNALELDVEATIPDDFKAIVGYLPAVITAEDSAGRVHTVVDIAPAAGTYDLFQLYDGELQATPGFENPEGHTEDGISLDFETLAGAGDAGAFDLLGNIHIPWNAGSGEGAGFGDITYNDVALDVGEVIAAIATPFEVVDPYLAPVRDVIDVLRTPIPVVSDLSELGGGEEVSLLYLLETLSAASGKPQLELAHRVIGLIEGVTTAVGAIAELAEEDVPLENLAAAGALLTLDPAEVEVYSKCTQTVTTKATSTTGGTGAATKPSKPAPCPDGNFLASEKPKKGVAGQTTNGNRAGTRAPMKKNVAQKTKSVTGSVPGFSLPFLADPDQLMDVITGEGEASYFRLDLGTLAASVAYTQKFGPIMAGPVPIVPFVGGSISVEGRLAMGFDSHAQTLAVESLSHPGAVQELMDTYANDFDGGDVIREGFYIDDLDADGVDVPEVKLVTTLQAGAGVSIGIVTAGLKGGITLTINLDLNDPDDDGRLRTAEIRDMFQGDPGCIFDASAELEAFISIFVEIELLLTSLEYQFDLLRLGPYTLFEYGCPDQVPTLVKRDGSTNRLLLTSGDKSDQRLPGQGDVSDDYEVRQFDSGGGAASDGTTSYEVSAFGRVQQVVVDGSGGDFDVTIYGSGITTSTDDPVTFSTSELPVFVADGGNADDLLSFLQGETFTLADDGEMTLTSTPFTTRVAALTGGPGNDALVTGAGDDTVDGEEGNDSIDVGQGDDVAAGGDGDDVVGGGVGRDDLRGGTGNDRLEGGAGADRANGQDGNDSLVGGPGRDVRAVLVLPEGDDDDDDDNGAADVVEEQVRLGFDSGDVLVGGPGADSVDGGDGSDVVVGGDAASLADASIGSLFGPGTRDVNVLVQGDTNPETQTVPDVDTATTPGPAALDDLCESGEPLAGDGNSDFVTGGPEADVVVGGDGADRLDGGSGPDEICGRAGDDQASGDGAEADDGDNADVIRAGHGHDRADGGLGADVLYGDDVRLVRSGDRVVDGSLGEDADGAGSDYLDGGDGPDVLAGGGGSDLLLGAGDDDQAFGEGRDTTEEGGAAPDVADRLLACSPTTRVVRGLVDLDGDLLAGDSSPGVTSDDGQLAGLRVDDGVILGLGTTTPFEGLIGSDVVVVGGRVDLDRDGRVGAADTDGGDTGMVALASMLATGDGNADGDCVIAGDGNDSLVGGTGSDHLSSGDGTDLALGGDGNDLVLGDEGVDVVLGGPHHDVLVGGLGDDHLGGGDGDDRLHGNEGADDLVGGGDESAADDGQDVLLGGSETDVLAAENAAPVSATIVDAVTDDSVPWRDGDDVPAPVTAGDSSDLRFDDSAVVCDDDEPDRWLTLLAADGVDGTPVQSPGAELAYDELYGGFGCDWVFGSTGDDLVRGGQDDDVVEAGPGADIVHGDDGHDVVVGGSSVDPATDTAVTVDRSGAGVRDGADVLRGDAGADGLDGSDLLAGDNALPVRVDDVTGVVGPQYALELHDVDVVTATGPAAALSGGDTLVGGADVDRMFGQGGDDDLAGGAGDDYAEGGSGDDAVSGEGGADDLVGGSSAADGFPLGTDGLRLTDSLDAAPYDASAAGLRDGADSVDGGAGADVALGDNGRVTRPGGARDIATTDEAGSTLSQTGGPDELRGGDDDDRLFGGDDDDLVTGGSDEDHLEGNGGDDRALGGVGEDTVIGGSSVSPAGDGTIGQLPTVSMADGDDVLHGDDATGAVVASDLVLGDNATVLTLTTGRTVVQLGDVPVGGPADPTASGDDEIDGGGAPDGNLGAADRIFGQGGDDTVTAGAADDYVEGNSGSDLLRTGSGEDDVLGGSSATDGRPLGVNGTRLQQRVVPRLDTSASRVLDEADEIHGGIDDDTVLGDNGRITRPVDGKQPVPDVAMADTSDPATYGSDELYGDEDHDVLHGQLDDGTGLGEGDLLVGGDGDDALLGDLAVVRRTPAAQLSAPRSLVNNSDFIREDVYQAGSIVPETYVPNGQAANGGPDLALGGPGEDVLHLGGGDDLGNGDADDDVVFGGDGDDALWGGVGHDRIFGGFGADDLDLKARSGDPSAYAAARGTEDEDNLAATPNGRDLVYGGWGPDELQADMGGPGRSPESDQLVDWVGAHNVYYVCEGAYGAGRVIRESSPGMMDLLVELATAAGAREVEERGAGGWYDLGLVTNKDKSANTQRSPEHPGHFTCEGGAMLAR